MSETNGNGNRPRASTATIINGGILATMILTMVVGGVMTMVAVTNSVADIRADVRVLQAQMSDVKADVHEVVKAVRDAQRR